MVVVFFICTMRNTIAIPLDAVPFGFAKIAKLGVGRWFVNWKYYRI